MNTKALLSFLRVVKHNSFFNGFAYDGPKYDEAYILANGPSLNDSLKNNNFEGKLLFAINHFARSNELYTRLKPKYYVFADPAFWRGEFSNTIFEDIVKNTTWDINVCIPSEVCKLAKIQEYFASNKFIKIVPYNKTLIEGYGNWQFKAFKRNYGMPIMPNVLIATLFLAINSGAKSIYVYGADHSWTQSMIVNDKNQVCLSDKHFYSDAKSVPWLKYDKTPFTMSEIMLAFYRTYIGHEYISNYAKKLGVRIINCTPGSFIDSYERSEK